MQDAIHERGKELEEAFFRKLNEKTVNALKERQEQAQSREGISKLTGITNTALLDTLVGLKLSPQTLAAFGLLPLVQVAWADGAVDEKEKKAVIDAAKQTGLAGSGLDLLGEWLAAQPPANLVSAWKAYVTEVTKRLSPADRDAMKREVLARARTVAEASGGILGLGNKVSKNEADVLADIEKTFG